MVAPLCAKLAPPSLVFNMQLSDPKHCQVNKRAPYLSLFFILEQMLDEPQFVCLSLSSSPTPKKKKKSKDIFHSKTLPSAAQYIYSAAGVALPSLLHLHLPSLLLCMWVPNSQCNWQPNSNMQPTNPMICLAMEKKKKKKIRKHWSWEGSAKSAIHSVGNELLCTKRVACEVQCAL